MTQLKIMIYEVVCSELVVSQDLRRTKGYWVSIELLPQQLHFEYLIYLHTDHFNSIQEPLYKQTEFRE